MFSLKGERIVVDTKFARENADFCAFSPYPGILEKIPSFHGSRRGETWSMCNTNLLREPRGCRAV